MVSGVMVSGGFLQGRGSLGRGVESLVMKLMQSWRQTILATPPGRMLKRAVAPKSRFPGLLAGCALETLLDHCAFSSVLDVGSGAGQHADIFQDHGKRVTTIDFGVSVYFKQKTSQRTDIIGDYYRYQFSEPFDCIWASHVLEHQPNPNLFLGKIHADLREGGWLAVTVPPLKHPIVGGHLTLWNAGLLVYQLVFAGFNCRHAAIRTYGYNVSVIVRKHSIAELPPLHYDSGDIDRLADYFPAGLKEGFDGRVRRLQWPPDSSAAPCSAGP